jgi:hypothetical protein
MTKITPKLQSSGHILAVNGLVVTVRFGDDRPKPNELLHVEDRSDVRGASFDRRPDIAG